MSVIILMVGLLLLLRAGVSCWLERLNQCHVRSHAAGVPEVIADVMDQATYDRSVQYTLANSRLAQVESVFNACLLGFVLFSGVLPWLEGWLDGHIGRAAWAQAGFLMLVGWGLSVMHLPLEWYDQFRLEKRFGFSTITPRVWWLDQFKGWLLALVLGWPLLILILKLVEWTGETWWLWAWAAFISFQFLLMVLAPVLILPLFNTFTPLPEGELRDRLLALAKRTGFQTSGIQVMDGSQRSRHSNAFFTGLGRLRRIVLFDTLVEQLDPEELEAVLAHEIGHDKLRHIPRMLVVSSAGSLVAFWMLSVLARWEGFGLAFGFETWSMGSVLLLFGLLAGTVTFWLSPLFNRLSRVHEYQADAFASRVMGGEEPLIRALRKLSEKNLSNLLPHPLYSGFHHSHPTLLERQRALAGGASG